MEDGPAVGTDVVEAEKQGEETSPKRVLLILLGGALLIYLSTWVGAVTFYLSFQRQLSDLEETMLWRVPVATEAGADRWESREVDGLRVPLPPGELLETRREGEFLEARFAEGEVRLQLLPEGMLGRLHAEMRKKLASRSSGVLSDTAALLACAHEDPLRYRFSWPAAERREYATRLLLKRLLWEDRPVRRSVIARDPAGGSASVLVEYDDGEVKIVAAREEGVLVAFLSPGVPEAWKGSPGPWLSGS